MFAWHCLSSAVFGPYDHLSAALILDEKLPKKKIWVYISFLPKSEEIFYWLECTAFWYRRLLLSAWTSIISCISSPKTCLVSIVLYQFFLVNSKLHKSTDSSLYLFQSFLLLDFLLDFCILYILFSSKPLILCGPDVFYYHAFNFFVVFFNYWHFHFMCLGLNLSMYFWLSFQSFILSFFVFVVLLIF